MASREDSGLVAELGALAGGPGDAGDPQLVAQRILLEQLAPDYAIVSEDGQIVSVSRGIGRFLDPNPISSANPDPHSEGAPAPKNFVSLANPSLRAAIRSILTEARVHHRRVEDHSATLSTESGIARVGLVAQPLPQPGEELPLYLVVLRELDLLTAARVPRPAQTPSPARTELVDRLEQELAVTRRDLDETVQELEASNEELKSSNEELQATNEELQSTNEELESSQEEVQTSNEALQRSNNDLENLLASTRIATLFLDPQMRILNFTPAVCEFYRLQATDLGREITDFRSQASVMPPFPDEATVRHSQQALESEVSMPDGRIFLRRILPYRTHEQKAEGIVVTFIDVSDLRRSEGRFRLLADAVPEMIWTTDENGKTQYFNSRWYEYTGQTPAQALGAGWLDAVHPDDLAGAGARWQKSIDSGEIYETEYRLRRHDGVFRWHKARCVPFRDGTGRPAQWFGNCSDIDDQKSASDLLRESGESLRTVIDAIPQLVWRTNPDGSADYASERFYAYVGLSAAEVLGWKWIELIHPDDRARVATDWEAARVKGAAISVDFRLRSPEGYRWFRSEGAPYFKDGELYKYYGTWTDIHERKLADAAREESENQFRTMANSIPQLAWMADPDGHLFWYNQRWYDYTGTNFDEMMDKGWQSIQHPDHLLRVSRKVTEFWREGWRKNDVWEDTFPLLGRDGKYRWFLSRMHPIKDAEGRVLRWFGTNTDIEDQRRLTADLEQAKDVAEQPNEAKTMFLANMSHEIRTPLTAITGFSDLLASAFPEDPVTNNYIHRITRNAHQLSRLIDELLDLSKIEAQKFEIEKVAVDLRAVIEDAVSAVSLRATEKGLAFEMRGLASLPERVLTDPTRLRQILINLVGNAVKFTQTGGVIVDLGVRGENADRQLEMKILDTGIGLSEEQRRRIFKPFGQADSSITRKFGGTGLGLALSRRLAGLLGGDLAIERTAPGEGSVFVLTIALEELSVPSPAGKAARQAVSAPKTDASLAGFRLLIVDDSKDNQVLVSRYVARAGATYETANDGAETVAKAADRSFDAILMDLQMPMMDGYTALKILRERGDRRPIVALTAHALQSEKDRCYEAGFDSYVTKPIDRALLLKVVHDLLNFPSKPRP